MLITARTRLGRTALAILVAFDQLVAVMATTPFAIAGLAQVPDPDETISGMLGRRRHKRWTRLPAALVDAVFLVLTLGCEREHCLRTAEREAERRRRLVADPLRRQLKDCC